jgi:hypothetical protein
VEDRKKVLATGTNKASRCTQVRKSMRKQPNLLYLVLLFAGGRGGQPLDDVLLIAKQRRA